MKLEQRKERFTELMSAVDMLSVLNPDDENYNPTLPNGTLGLSDTALSGAIMAQAVRSDEVFQGNLVNALAKTGMETITNKINASLIPSEDDVQCAVMAVHIAWAIGAFTPLGSLLGAFSRLHMEHNLEIPSNLLWVFRAQDPLVESASKIDPNKVLSLTTEDIIKELTKRSKPKPKKKAKKGE